MKFRVKNKPLPLKNHKKAHEKSSWANLSFHGEERLLAISKYIQQRHKDVDEIKVQR